MSQPYVPQPVDPRFDPRFDPRSDPRNRPGAPPARTSTTGAKVMAGIGAALTVLALVLVVVGIVRLTDTVSEDALDVRPGEAASVEVRQDIPDPAEFRAESDTRYAVLFIGPGDEDVDVDDLTVTGPRGEVNLVENRVSYTFSSNRTATHLATFEADVAGSYTLTVDGPSASARGDLAIIDDDLVAGLVVGAVSGVLLIVAGGITGVLGLGLLVGGVVWWSVRRSAVRAAGR